MVRFDRDKSYGLGGSRLKALTAVSAALNDPTPMSFDKRRNLANLIDLVLNDAVALANQAPETQ